MGVPFPTRRPFYRVFSLVNSGRAVEEDLFAGVGRQAAYGPPPATP